MVVDKRFNPLERNELRREEEKALSIMGQVGFGCAEKKLQTQEYANN